MTQVNDTDLSILCFEKRRKKDQKKAQQRLHVPALDIEERLQSGDPFLKDCYRIISTRKFRKMGHTMQVMLGGGVLFRSRLTHAIDSSIIAERIAINHFGWSGKSLTLLRASVLGHDIGQSPLGHGGDEAIKIKLKEYGVHFDEYEGAIKVLTKWSNYGLSYQGLNPTLGVTRQLALGGNTFRKGEHAAYKDPTKIPVNIREIDQKFDLELDQWADPEGIIAGFSDGLSWINEDIMLGLVEGVFTLKEIVEASPLVARIYSKLIDDLQKNGCEKVSREIEEKYSEPLNVKNMDFIKLLSHSIQQEMIIDLTNETKCRILEYKSAIKYADDVRKTEERLITFSPSMFEQWNYLFKFFDTCLYPRLLQANKSFESVVSKVFDHMFENPEFMPAEYQKKATKLRDQDLARLVAEYMTREMTDKDILQEIEEIDPGLFEALISHENAKDIEALI